MGILSLCLQMTRKINSLVYLKLSPFDHVIVCFELRVGIASFAYSEFGILSWFFLSMCFLAWNVRGADDLYFLANISRILRKHEPHIFFILETKFNDFKMPLIFDRG